MNKENIGIIAEFNPLHNGHKYLIDSIKKDNPDCSLIVAMSGNFVQRGEIAVYDKWVRSKAAISNGVDLVLEIPPFFVLNNANIFAKKAIQMLNNFGVKKIYFGSENLDINEIKKYADFIIENDDKLNELKNELHSLPKALSKLIGNELKPNEILGICYVMETKLLNLDINFYRIKRESNDEFTSSSKIRKQIKNGVYSSNSLMNVSLEYNDLNNYSDILKGKIATSHSDDNLINYFKKLIIENNSLSFEELINKGANSSFTKSRLRRDILKFILELEGTDHTIILASNIKGNSILKEIDNYFFRHDKMNVDNYNVERFLSLKTKENLSDRLSKSNFNK